MENDTPTKQDEELTSAARELSEAVKNGSLSGEEVIEALAGLEDTLPVKPAEPNRHERRRSRALAKSRGSLSSAQKAFRARQARKNKRKQARKK